MEEVNTNGSSYDRAVRHVYIPQYESFLIPTNGLSQALRDIYLLIGLYGFRIYHSREVLSIATGARRRWWFTRHDSNSLQLKLKVANHPKSVLQHAAHCGPGVRRGSTNTLLAHLIAPYWYINLLNKHLATAGSTSKEQGVMGNILQLESIPFRIPNHTLPK